MNIQFLEVKRKDSDYEKFKTLYHSAFPAYEQMPVWLLLKKSKSEDVLFYHIYDDETWIGFVYIIIDEDLLLLQYFAIDDSVRSKGYGGEILLKIKEKFSKYRIFFGIEQPDEKAENNEQRIKRKNFYEKHGFHDSGYTIKQSNVTFEILLRGNPIVIDDFYRLMEKLWGKFIWSIAKKFIKIHKNQTHKK